MTYAAVILLAGFYSSIFGKICKSFTSIIGAFAYFKYSFTLLTTKDRKYFCFAIMFYIVLILIPISPRREYCFPLTRQWCGLFNGIRVIS